MEEVNTTFLLLKKAILENKRIKDNYIATFSAFDYTYFFNELLGEQVRDWNWKPSDVSKEIIAKDLIPIFAPLAEFEIKLPAKVFMEFLPAKKFAFTYKSDYKELCFRFKSNGYVTFTCYEKEDISGNSVFATYCPRDNFYNLLTVMTLIVLAAVYDKKNLELFKQNFQEGCFYLNLARGIEENFSEIRQRYETLEKKLKNNFSWQEENPAFINIMAAQAPQPVYLLRNFPAKGVISKYSFCINEYEQGLEFNFEELEEVKQKKCFYRNLSRKISLEIPTAIKIYAKEKKLFPYKVVLEYNYSKEKFKEVVELRYNLKSEKLELEKNQNVSAALEKGLAIFLASGLPENLLKKVEENLFNFCAAAKTKDATMFVPLKDYFASLRKLLFKACRVTLLLSKF